MLRRGNVQNNNKTNNHNRGVLLGNGNNNRNNSTTQTGKTCGGRLSTLRDFVERRPLVTFAASCSLLAVLLWLCVALPLLWVLLDVLVWRGPTYYSLYDASLGALNSFDQEFIDRLVMVNAMDPAIVGPGFQDLFDGVVDVDALNEEAAGGRSVLPANRVLMDMSGRGQFRFVLWHLQSRRKLLPMEARVVVDIGANDGFQGSHSFNFYQLGWRIGLVEPQPSLVSVIRDRLDMVAFDLERNFAMRSVGASGFLDSTLSLCVSGDTRTSTSLAHTDVCSERVEVQVESVETLMKRIDRNIATQVNKIPEQIRFHNYIGIPSQFGVLSIDVEGLERDIVEGYLASEYRPVYIIVEVVKYVVPQNDGGVEGHGASSTGSNIAEMKELLRGQGYTMLTRLGNDCIFYSHALD